MNAESTITSALGGIVQANLPEIVGTAGVYVTFKDQKYVYQLMLDQVKESGLFNTLIGAVMPIIIPLLTRFKNRGNNNGGSRRRRRNRNKKKQN